MKILIFLIGLASLGLATPVIEDHQEFATISHQNKQTFILKLLNHVMQPCMYKEVEELGRNFNIEDNKDIYMKVDVVKRFVRNFKFGMLPRGEIFTLHVEQQMREVIDMFHLLYYAKDFTTFLKTACWMRLHCNEGMFVYALTIAVRHREDCRGIYLPPPYEIYPYFFVRSDVIQKAYMLKMKKGLLDTSLCKFYGITNTDKDIYIIDENVYDTRVYLNKDDNLRYFTEDIGLNTYYYYFHVDFPYWMKDDLLLMDKFNIRRGELMLYTYQQILARYYLERLSNGLGEIHEMSWQNPIKIGYWPWMKYHTGVEMPVRYNNYVAVTQNNIDVMRLVEDYETIIRDAVLKGFLITYDGVRIDLHKADGIDALGKIIYGKVDKYHGDLYRYILILMQSIIGLNGFHSDKYFVVPSVLDHYQTALRDPVFYMLQKRLVNILFLYKKKLPSYTREELYYPGVELEKVYADKLVTYFEDYIMDMTTALYLDEEELKKGKSDMTFFVRKRRLNHKPFKLTMEVNSDKAGDCMIRVFLGPKYDHMGRLIDINRNRVNFVEIDNFVHDLTIGKNVIIRNSIDMHNYVKDRVMTRDFWSKITSGNDFQNNFENDYKNFHTGFPLRLLLPKGTVNGMEMMLYVIVSPLKLVDNVDLQTVKDNHHHMDYRFTTLLDKMPLGFPLDREINVSYFFGTNMKFSNIMIYHDIQMCHMRSRWEYYVLRNYNLKDMTSQDYHYTDNTSYYNSNNNNINMYKQIHTDF